MTTASKTQAHLSERTYTPLAIAAFLLGTAILSGAAEPNEMLAALRQQSVTLRLEGKEKPSALLVPAEFKAASSVSEIAIRDSQLATMNSNPERSTRYSDWMVYDWNAPKNMPWLMVASMGGLIRRQGMISEAEWNRFKAEALCLQGQDLANRIADAERRIRNGAKLNYEIMKREITEIFVSDSDSVTFMIDLAVETESGPMDVWCTSKLLYTDRSIVTGLPFRSEGVSQCSRGFENSCPRSFCAMSSSGELRAALFEHDTSSTRSSIPTA